MNKFIIYSKFIYKNQNPTESRNLTGTVKYSEKEIIQIIDSGNQEKMLHLIRHHKKLSVSLAARIANKATNNIIFDELIKRCNLIKPTS